MCYQRDHWLPIGSRGDWFFSLEVFESSADTDRLSTRPDRRRDREKAVKLISPFGIILLNEELNAMSGAIKGAILPVTFFDNLLSLQ